MVWVCKEYDVEVIDTAPYREQVQTKENFDEDDFDKLVDIMVSFFCH